jgi:HSP20 family protein
MNYVKIRFADNQGGMEHDLFKTVEEMLHGAQPRFALARQRWRPHVDIYETDREIVVIAEIAGIQSTGVELEIATRAVKISGTREVNPTETIGRYCLAEIPSGYFERTVTLPAPIDTETAETEYGEGLLKIRLPKNIPKGISKITVKSRAT